MLRRALSSPALYAAWALFVVGALLATYAVDPVVFGVTAFALAWFTGAVAIVAVAVLAFWGVEWTRTRRLLVAAGVVVAVAAVASALAVLRTFKWA